MTLPFHVLKLRALVSVAVRSAAGSSDSGDCSQESTPVRFQPSYAKSAKGHSNAGKLSVLFCSPTMELGIDIKDLSAVHMLDGIRHQNRESFPLEKVVNNGKPFCEGPFWVRLPTEGYSKPDW